jgi:predicted NodU family carbamoyl transferase
LIILGLAIATSQHHAAALVIDGQVVGALEEERLNGIKAYGWHPSDRPDANLINTDGLSIKHAVCRKSVNLLLKGQGLEFSDVDVIAVNGVPFRYQPSRECVRDGRYVFVPHHLAHAASVARTAPYESGNVLTIDGRGEYETAAFFTYDEGELVRRLELPAGEGRSIGGVYETVTRCLGFGSNGQGQTMALASAAIGDPRRLAEAFHIRSFSDYTIDEHRMQELAHRRLEEASDDKAKEQLASDLQAAMEEGIIALGRDAQSQFESDRWMLAGGVTLNCCANSKLRDALGVELWVTNAAHDAGTALGAALEAAHLLGEAPAQVLSDAGLGPSFNRSEAIGAIEVADLRWEEDSLSRAVDYLCEGRVIGFCQSGMEYGPRALGHRSIVAHPGWTGIQDRVNRIKDRQLWRPFGPSVLAEHALDFFEDDRFGPFMTFTTRVLPEKRDAVRGIVHCDGTTRPQSVTAHAEPAWRRLIEMFYERTGLPMVLNTSFNGRGKPIVCTPTQAIAEARALRLDALVLGDVFVDLVEETG